MTNLPNPLAPDEHAKQLLIKIYQIDLLGGPFVSEGKQVGQIQFIVGKGVELPSEDLLKEMFPPFIESLIMAANPGLESETKESVHEQTS